MDEFAAARQLYAARGLGSRVGWGERPAVIAVDMINGFTDPAYPIGADVSAAIAETCRVLDGARNARLPVFFTSIAYDDPVRDGGHWIRKIPALNVLRSGTQAVEVDHRLQRRPSEPLVVKRFASSFFGTDLASRLQFLRVDTLIVCGVTTSGCVRATVVDGLQLGFRCIVPEAAVADRAEAPHRANLFDMNGKYGDVLPLDEVLAEITTRARPAD